MILYGVPQGSVLGPLLFILYKKDLSDLVKQLNIALQLYADDSTLYMKFNPTQIYDVTKTKETLEKCLNEIKKWMLKNLMKLNDDKTQLIIFGKRHNILNKYPIDFELSFNDYTITGMLLDTDSKEEDGKCLRILLENDLSMKRQITNVKSPVFMYFMILGKQRNISQLKTN